MKLKVVGLHVYDVLYKDIESACSSVMSVLTYQNTIHRQPQRPLVSQDSWTYIAYLIIIGIKTSLEREREREREREIQTHRQTHRQKWFVVNCIKWMLLYSIRPNKRTRPLPFFLKKKIYTVKIRIRSMKLTDHHPHAFSLTMSPFLKMKQSHWRVQAHKRWA